MNEYETNPAYGLIGAYRTSISPPGAALFDSDIRHQHTVVVRIARADRQRDLHRDWIHEAGGPGLIEIEMSEAQWASFVSSMNTAGVPCTLRRVGGEEVPRIEYRPRLEESMAETRRAADDAFAGIAAALAAYEEKKSADNLRSLRAAIANAGPNVEFAGRSLAEHAENVVTKARADIEAIAADQARRVLEAAPRAPELEEGES